VFDLGDWLEANWKQAVAAAAGVVVIVLAVVGWNGWRGRTLGQANVALGEGLAAYEPERGADGTAPPPRTQEALASFEKAASLGGSRPVGEIARYYKALSLIALGRGTEAVPILEEVAAGGSRIAAQAKVSLANALAEKGDYDRAAALLQEVAAATGASFPPDAALAMLGAMRVRQGRADEARKVYEDLLTRYPQSSLGPDVRQRIAELGGTLPASSSGTIR
jgi:TolA-binding protein